MELLIGYSIKGRCYVHSLGTLSALYLEAIDASLPTFEENYDCQKDNEEYEGNEKFPVTTKNRMFAALHECCSGLLLLLDRPTTLTARVPILIVRIPILTVRIPTLIRNLSSE